MAMSFGTEPVIDTTVEEVENEVLEFETPEPEPEVGPEDQPVPVEEPDFEPSHPETTPENKK